MFQLVHHLGTGITATTKGIAAIGVKLGARDVERQRNLIPWLVSSFLDGLDQDLSGFLIAEIRSEAAFIAHGGAHATFAEQVFQGVEHLSAHPQRLSEVGCAVRNEHELLEIQVVGGMGASIDHIHQRHRQQRCHRTSEIAIERQA